LEEKLLLLYGLREDRAVQEEVQRKLGAAAASIRRFGPGEVGRILRRRLEEVEVSMGTFVGG